MVGFVVAMEVEARPLLEKMEIRESFKLTSRHCLAGKLYGKEAALIISDIGKVNAASATQALLSKFPQIDKIVNYGVAGAVNPALKICDICAVEKVLQYDFDLSAIDDVPVGYIQNLKRQYIHSDAALFEKVFAVLGKRAVVATADRFSAKDEEARFVRSLGADMREMELGAIAHVCCLNNVPFVGIKAVSDTAEGDASADFKENLTRSCRSIEEYLPKIMEAL